MGGEKMNTAVFLTRLCIRNVSQALLYLIHETLICMFVRNFQIWFLL